MHPCETGIRTSVDREPILPLGVRSAKVRTVDAKVCDTRGLRTYNFGGGMYCVSSGRRCSNPIRSAPLRKERSCRGSAYRVSAPAVVLGRVVWNDGIPCTGGCAGRVGGASLPSLWMGNVGSKRCIGPKRESLHRAYASKRRRAVRKHRIPPSRSGCMNPFPSMSPSPPRAPPSLLERCGPSRKGQDGTAERQSGLTR